MPPFGGFFLRVPCVNTLMPITFDFQIINISGDKSLVCAQNEEAYEYLVDESPLNMRDNGYAEIYTQMVGDFISDAGHAHLCCNLI